MNEELRKASLEGRIDIVEKLLKSPSLLKEIETTSFGGELIEEIYMSILEGMKKFYTEHYCDYCPEFKEYSCCVYSQIPDCPSEYHGSIKEERKIFKQINIIVKLLNSGADMNTLVSHEREKIKNMIEVYSKNNLFQIDWILQKGKTDDKDNKALKILKDKKENSLPKKLVKTLTNFTVDTPIKYTTHLWDFGGIKKEYKDFRGFIEAVSKQWKNIEKELKELSPNLHTKIYNFLLNKSSNDSWCSRADISIGWSSLEGLEEWCNEGNSPFDFKLPKPYEIDNKTITTFGEVINLFKREIEIRNENNMLERIFLEEQEKLGGEFGVDLIKLKGRTFYTDVEKFQESIGRIFEEIRKRNAYEICIEVVEPNAEFIELKITQLNSSANRSSKEMLNKVDDGDFKILKENLTNLCDWSIESSNKQESYRVNYLRSSNVKEIEKLSYDVDRFTHILRFHKK